MGNIEFSSMDQFQLMFNEVRNACLDDPNKLSTFYNQHPELKEKVDRFYSYVKYQGFEKHFQFYSGKVTNTSASFIADWNEYLKKWKEVIWSAKFQFLDFDELFKDVDIEKLDFPKPDKKQDEYDRSTWAPELDDEDEFDPTVHNGGMAVEAAFEALWRIVDIKHNDELSDPWIGNEAKIGYEALDYFKEQIGMDFNQVFRRWFLTPKILVPPKAQAKLTKGGGDIYSCYDQLNSAIRSFVLGNDLASFTMCRASIEQVLRLYIPSKPEVKLHKIIVAADAKYEHIQKGKIEKFVAFGNKVLHEPSKITKNAYEIEQALLQYFKTIKFLIERYK